VRASLEFRHASWFDEDVYALLREHDAAMCISDQGEGEDAVPFVSTASWGYMRLRADGYEDAELSQHASSIREQAWTETYAFFKHEETAPAMAARLDALSREAG